VGHATAYLILVAIPTHPRALPLDQYSFWSLHASATKRF
jgi:hypothetical protein